MINLSLTTEDAVLLRDTLEAKLRDLRREISHTDSPRYRDTLERLEELLQRVVDQLGTASATL